MPNLFREKMRAFLDKTTHKFSRHRTSRNVGRRALNETRNPFRDQDTRISPNTAPRPTVPSTEARKDSFTDDGQTLEGAAGVNTGLTEGDSVSSPGITGPVRRQAEEDEPSLSTSRGIKDSDDLNKSNDAPTSRSAGSSLASEEEELRSVKQVLPSQDPTGSYPSSSSVITTNKRLQRIRDESSEIQINFQPPTRTSTFVDETNKANVSSRLVQQSAKAQLSPLLIPNLHRSRSSTGSSKRDPPPIITGPDLTAPILQKKITVKVLFTFQEERIFMDDVKLEDFDWTEPENYEVLIPTKILEKVQKTYDLESQQMYPRHGSCRVKGPPGLHVDGHYAILDDMEVLSQKAIVNICGFISKHPSRPFSLEVYWDYGFVKLEKIGTETYAEMIHTQLKLKVKHNFLGLPYIPRCDLDVFLSLEVVEHVIREDTKLQLDGDLRTEFVARVIEKAAKLFAICVYFHLDMEYLRHLIDDHRFSDDPSSRPKHNTSGSCDIACSVRLRDVVRRLPSFFVQDIKRDYQHLTLHDEDVLPLFHTGEQSAGGRLSMHLLGENEGAVGKVYRVKIDRAHHYVSGDPGCEFAVKQFLQLEPFRRECVMLEQFANFPDNHIAGHIMTWSQRGLHHILYDKAKSSLRRWINGTQRPELTNSVVIWFLNQLKGLAHAIKHVHNFKKPTRANPDPVQDDKWGRHNDIKPENILVFERDEHQNPVFKITDFGQGILKDAKGLEVSERDPKALGTRAYWSPETNSKGGVSRPIDMWALGCVFLELMLWLFGFYRDESKIGFSTARQEFPGHNPDNLNDMFWYKVPRAGRSSSRELKPIVQRALNDLETVQCLNMRAFKKVLSAIRRLLEVKPDQRMKAGELAEAMSQVVREAERDLGARGVPDFYQRQYRENCGGSEVGEGLPSERLNVGSPSVSRAHSPSSSRGHSPLGYGPALSHSTSAPPVLLQAGSAALAGDNAHYEPRRSLAADGPEHDALLSELEGLD